MIGFWQPYYKNINKYYIMSENNDFDWTILRELLTQQQNARTTHNKILTMINLYTYILNSNFDKFIINYSKNSTLPFLFKY